MNATQTAASLPAPITFTVRHTVEHVFTAQDVSDLLCCALEGGSNYWYEIKKFEKPAQPRSATGDTEIYRHLDYPLTGGALVITDVEGDGTEEFRLDGAALQRGLEVMAVKYPHHMADLLDDNTDATTGDVFLQCCLFGEIVYG